MFSFSIPSPRFTPSLCPCKVGVKLKRVQSKSDVPIRRKGLKLMQINPRKGVTAKKRQGKLRSGVHMRGTLGQKRRRTGVNLALVYFQSLDITG